MDGLKNLLNSEKALVLLSLVIAATALTISGQMTVTQWKEYTTWLAGFYVAGKTVQGVGDAMAAAKVGAAQAAPPPAATTSTVMTTSTSTPQPTPGVASGEIVTP